MDLWSAGCVLAEMIHNKEGKNKKMFKGDSCYPMSPRMYGASKVSKDDQLIKIMRKVESDAEFVRDKRAREYCEMLMESFSFKSCNLQEVFEELP